MIQLIVVVAVAGLVVWAITTFIPMADPAKKIIYVVFGICILFYLLNAFGVLGGHDIPVPRLRT